MVIGRSADEVERERSRRFGLWSDLRASSDPEVAPAALLRALGIFGGAQGIWVDSARTRMAVAPSGITVGLLHTGRHYPDDLAEDSIIYHYPSTRRPKARDNTEVAATKAARELTIPLFVITPADANPHSMRRVQLGWVADWDDELRQFLVLFQDEAPGDWRAAAADEQEIEPIGERRTRTAQGTFRLGQARFRFEVLKRYGACCAVCDVKMPVLLDAAHIVSDAMGGISDPRNGLVLCPTHHRAYDADLFRIHPETLEIVSPTRGPDLTEIGIGTTSITHLRAKPSKRALAVAFLALQ